MAKLKDLGQIITGNTPKTSETQNYESNDICFVKPSDISDFEITKLLSSEYYISENARNRARVVPKGSILVTCIGIIGKVSILKVECAFNQQINAIIPDTSIVDSEYLANAIISKKLYIQEKANAAVVPIINKTQFSELEIPLPPLEEQHKIAAVLDKASSLIALRKQQLEKLDNLVKARFVEMFGDIDLSFNKPEWTSISDIGNVVSGSTPKTSVEEYWNGDLRWISPAELKNDTGYIYDSVKKIRQYRVIVI
ncbi:restriction endonuclease subunit S [Dysosmobacter sp.]